MFTENDSFQRPENPDITIWRYMNFAKFITLLENNSLFFPKITALPDDHEGYLNKATINFMRQSLNNYSGSKKKRHEENLNHNLQVIKTIRKRVGICSWNMNDTESVSMWKVYLNQSDGIAIKSTYNKLKNCFYKTQFEIHIGIVKYIDVFRDIIRWRSIFEPLIYKRNIFYDEHELRAVVLPNPPIENPGIYINVDLNILIDTIVLAPNSPFWFFELLNKVLNRYNLKKSIEKSIVDIEPSY